MFYVLLTYGIVPMSRDLVERGTNSIGQFFFYFWISIFIYRIKCNDAKLFRQWIRRSFSTCDWPIRLDFITGSQSLFFKMWKSSGATTAGFFPVIHTVSFQIFLVTFIYDIFLVKNCTREFFRQIAAFSSKTLSFDIVWKKIGKKIVNSQLSLLDFHNLKIFFQCHESIGDLA